MVRVVMVPLLSVWAGQNFLTQQTTERGNCCWGAPGLQCTDAKDDDCRVDEFCGASQSQCESCSGVWCPDTPTPVPTPVPPPPSPSPSPSPCPGGSVDACIDMCPPATFTQCVEDCQTQCGGGPSPVPPMPTPQPVPTPKPTPTPTPVPTPSPVPSPGDCNFYQKDNSHCADGCGQCFNPGSRSAEKCKGDSTGYFCSSDSPPDGADMAFACMDWTFGSSAMKDAESKFNARTNDDVFFGVGTYGSAAGLGACYRITAEGVSKDLLVQSINTGSDVSGKQFDLMIGDGGAGAYNTCAGGKQPGVDTMFPGEYTMDTWGRIYGGVDNREQCANLPHHAFVDGPMKQQGDDLVELCEYGFDQGVRQQSGGNPNILKIGRVKCPAELVEFTQILRNDDPSEYACGSDCQQATGTCQASSPGAGLEWCLTRMMDCRKPSGAFITNIQSGSMVDGYRVVQPCLSDGYTRIDVQCGCDDCYC